MDTKSPNVINIGRPAPMPRLNVVSPKTTGAIKLSSLSPIANLKSVNFGPGAEMLMNPKKQNSTSPSVQFEDLSSLEAKLNSDLTAPRVKMSSAREQMLSGAPPGVTLNISEKSDKNKFMKPITEGVHGPPGATEHTKNTSNLGSSSVEADKKKTETWDGFKKFSEIPVNPNVTAPPKPRMSSEEILRQKIVYLRKLEALSKKGIKLTKKYTMESPLLEMKGEYEMIKNESEKRSSVKFQGKMLMAAVSAIEFLNSKFDPFDLKLDGWAEAVNENLDEYDDVFGELHEKYAGKAKIAPELKLLFMLGGSAAMLHMTNTMFKSSLPGMDDIMRQNPELMQQFTNAAVNSMRQEQPGFGGFMSGMMGGSMGMPQGGSRPMRPMRGAPPNRPDIGMSRGRPEFSDAVNMENSFNPVPSSQHPQRSHRKKRPDMKGPDNINDILSGLKTKKINIQGDKKDVGDNKSTISIDELKDIKSNVSVPQRSKRKPRSERNTVTLQL